MLTAMHMVDSTFAPPSSSPWLPPDHHLSASPPPLPPPATTAATLHHLLAAGRRIAKRRRPRPSRRLPTTYISADPANFRRMVHQVTGADNLPPPAPPALSSQHQPELLRPVPGGAPLGSAGAGALMLPTLDTSAYLLGRSKAAPAPAAALVGGGAYTTSNNSSSSNSNSGFTTLDSWDLHLL